MNELEQRVAQVLREAFDELDEAPGSPEARAATIAAMEQASRRRRAPKPQLWWVLAAAMLTAMVGAGFVALLRHPAPIAPPPPEAIAPMPAAPVLAETSVLAAHGEVDAPRVGEPWPPARRLKTGSDGTLRARVATATIELRANSEVELVSRAHIVVVRGEVLAELTRGETTLSLESTDVLIAARSARFWVAPRAGCRGQTEVRVISGEVTVTSQGVDSVVAAEERWPPAQSCAEPSEAPRPPAHPRGPKPPSLAPPPREAEGNPSNQPSAAPEPVDALGHQNALYAGAQAARHAGHVEAAIEQLDQLLREYPTGALAESALLEKVRWLRVTSPPRAREAAQHYLDRFPRGVGRAEAEALVLEPLP